MFSCVRQLLHLILLVFTDLIKVQYLFVEIRVITTKTKNLGKTSLKRKNRVCTW